MPHRAAPHLSHRAVLNVFFLTLSRALRNGHSGGAVAILVLLLSAGSAPALDCDDPRIRPLDGPAGYSARDGDQRCEGFYESPVSGNPLDLVSATIGEPPSANAERVVLHVPGENIVDPVRLRAQALQPRLYYRMDAEIVAGSPFSWPLGDVVKPAGLDFTAIGIVATTTERQRTTVLPVVYGTMAASSRPTRLVFRSFVDLDRLVWRLTPAGSAEGEWREVAKPRVAAGEVRVVHAEPVGEAVLALRGLRAGTGSWIARDVMLRLPEP